MTSRDRAWGWVAHLRDGGTTAWTAWSGSAEPGPRSLPGAQQLELLRRVNQCERPPGRLVQRVLEASAPGRGRPDLELAGVEDPPRFGPRPVDPGSLQETELLRVATALIAEDLVAAGVPDPDPGRRPRRRRRRYRLAGDPWLVAPVRAALTAEGRPPGGPAATVHVLGTDLASMVRHSWMTGTFAEGGRAWPDFLAALRRRDRVPRRVDLPAIADRWRRTPGPVGVDVVLDLAALSRLVGARTSLTRLLVTGGSPGLGGNSPLTRPLLTGGSAVVAAHAAELARRVAGSLGILVVPPRRNELLRGRLLPRLADVPGPAVAIPVEHREWVEEQAAVMRRQLLRGGYSVVGDPDLLLPRWGADSAGVDDVDLGDVLGLAIELLLRPVTREESP